MRQTGFKGLTGTNDYNFYCQCKECAVKRTKPMPLVEPTSNMAARGLARSKAKVSKQANRLEKMRGLHAWKRDIVD